MCVLPSESEGLSVAVLEGMSYGKCVLVSDIEANLEAIGQNGKSFANKDVKNLELKLRDLIENQEIVAQIGQKAKEYVLEKYNWDDIGKELDKLYRIVKYRDVVIKECKEHAVEQKA